MAASDYVIGYRDHRRRRKGQAGRVSALLLAAVLHGLLVLSANRLATIGRDLLEPTLFLTLEPDRSEPAPLAPRAAPSGEATAPPPPSAPPEQRLADGQGGEVRPPERPHTPKITREGKRRVVKAAPQAAVRPHSGSPTRAAAPEAAVASGQPAGGEMALKKSAEDLPPRAIHQPPPDYPARARARGWQGTVVVEVLVDSTGRVREARLAATSGHEILDRAALAKVGTWRFQPTSPDSRYGGRLPTRPVRVPIRFQINASQE